MSAAPAIDARSRASDLAALEAQRFDLAIVGGGITGAGIACDAARRGLAVALLEADDFAAGTSSRSSKLIHGGLRYLAMGDVALVRETALERKRVRRLAPHLAEPVWMVVPARSRAKLLSFRAGLGTYEKLGAVEAGDRHRNWSTEEVARNEPALDRERYPFACAYREYLSDDARLVLANLRAAAACGARVVSHLRVDDVPREDGRASGASAACSLTGVRVRVRARCVVNAAGPWVDALRRLEDPSTPPRLHLSKGIHVALPPERLPVRNCVVLGTADRRSIFAIRRGDVVYLGTTDTSHPSGSEWWPEITREDVAYLLAPVTRYFRVHELAPGDCVGAWAGLRPLVAQPGKAPREMSRRDEVSVGPAGVVTVAGGKLTGYRKMAEEVLEEAARVLGVPLPPARSEDEPLPGGDFDGDLEALAARLAGEHRLAERVALRLARLYGSEATEVAARGPQPLCDGAAAVAGEVAWAVEKEGAQRLGDLVYRRTRTALYEPLEAEGVAEAAVPRMAERLGWSAARSRAELEHVRARLRSDTAFRTRETAA